MFKNEGTSLWKFFPTSSGLINISQLHIVRCNCYQLSSTDDRHQFIILSVDLCVKRFGREAARRAGLSASSENCLQTDRPY